MYLSSFSISVFRVCLEECWHHAYPENLHVLYCHVKLAFFVTCYVFGSCFRMLAVILVSDFLIFFILF